MAAEQSVRIFQVVQTLGRGLVAAVGQEAVGLQQSGGADELVRVPPEARARRGAAGAQNALVQAIEFVAFFRALQTLFFGRHGVVDQVRFDRVVLLEELRHVHDQIANYGQAGQGLQDDGAGQAQHIGQAGQTIFAVDVHCVGAAHAFAAGAAKGNCGVDCLELHQGVQQHAFVAIQFDLDGLHIGLGVLVRIVAVDGKSA